MSILSSKILPGGKKAAAAFVGAIVAAIGIQATTDPTKVFTKPFAIQLGLVGAAGVWNMFTRPVTMPHADAEVARAAIVDAKAPGATDGAGVPAAMTGAPLAGATYTGPTDA